MDFNNPVFQMELMKENQRDEVMLIANNKRVTLNLDLELKPGHTEEEFYCFLSYTLKYFIKPEDVARFKQQYLSENLNGDEVTLS